MGEVEGIKEEEKEIVWYTRDHRGHR